MRPVGLAEDLMAAGVSGDWVRALRPGVAVGMPPGGSKPRFTPVGLVTCGILVGILCLVRIFHPLLIGSNHFFRGNPLAGIP